jgi:hypothetical protein
VQWVRQSLVTAGEIDGTTRGVWKITPKGRDRLARADKESTPIEHTPLSLRDLVNKSRDEAKARLLTELTAGAITILLRDGDAVAEPPLGQVALVCLKGEPRDEESYTAVVEMLLEDGDPMLESVVSEPGAGPDEPSGL